MASGKGSKKSLDPPWEESIDVRAIRALMVTATNPNYLRTLNTLLQNALAEDRRKHFESLKELYELPSEGNESFLDVETDSPLPTIDISKRTSRREEEEKKQDKKSDKKNQDDDSQPKRKLSLEDFKTPTKKKAFGRKTQPIEPIVVKDDDEEEEEKHTQASAHTKKTTRRPGRQPKPIDTGVSEVVEDDVMDTMLGEDSQFDQSLDSLSSISAASTPAPIRSKVRGKGKGKGKSTKKAAPPAAASASNVSTASKGKRPDLPWCSSCTDDEDETSKKNWTELELATAYNAAADFKDIVIGRFNSNKPRSERNRLRNLAFKHIKKMVNSIGGRKRRKKALYYKMITFKSDCRKRAKELQKLHNQSGGRGVTEKEKLTALEVMVLAFYGPECCGVIPGSWKRPLETDQSSEMITTAANMLEMMDEAEKDQKKAIIKATEDYKRQLKAQKEVHGISQKTFQLKDEKTEKDEDEYQGSQGDDEGEKIEEDYEPSQKKKRLTLKKKKKPKVEPEDDIPIVISPIQSEDEDEEEEEEKPQLPRTSPRLKAKAKDGEVSPLSPTPPTRSSDRIKEKEKDKSETASIGETLDGLFTSKRKLKYSSAAGSSKGAPKVSTPLPKADDDEDTNYSFSASKVVEDKVEDSEGEQVKQSKKPSKVNDGKEVPTKFKDPKGDTIVIGDPDEGKKKDASGDDKTKQQKIVPKTRESDVIIVVDKPEGAETVKIAATLKVLGDDIKLVKADTRTLATLHAETACMSTEVKTLVNQFYGMKGDYDNVHSAVVCMKQDGKSTFKHVQSLVSSAETSTRDLHLMKGKLGVLTSDFQDVKVDVAASCGNINSVGKDIELLKNDVQEMEVDMRIVKSDIKKNKAHLSSLVEEVRMLKTEVVIMNKNMDTIHSIHNHVKELVEAQKLSVAQIKEEEDENSSVIAVGTVSHQPKTSTPQHVEQPQQIEQPQQEVQPPQLQVEIPQELLQPAEPPQAVEIRQEVEQPVLPQQAVEVPQEFLQPQQVEISQQRLEPEQVLVGQTVEVCTSTALTEGVNTNINWSTGTVSTQPLGEMLVEETDPPHDVASVVRSVIQSVVASAAAENRPQPKAPARSGKGGFLESVSYGQFFDNPAQVKPPGNEGDGLFPWPTPQAVADDEARTRRESDSDSSQTCARRSNRVRKPSKKAFK